MKALFYLFVIGVSIVGTAKAERYMVCGGRNAVQCESGMTCEYIQGADYGYCRTESRLKQISCLSKEY